MALDVAALLNDRRGENFALHNRLMDPQLARILKTLGFDRLYVGGEGCYLVDDRGERYLDMLSGFGVFALGRSHPTVKAALHQALDLNLPNMVQIDCALLPGLLAEELVGRSHPGIQRAFFCNSGAEAIETAVKFARRATGRPRIVGCDHAFHGLTTGALSLNGGDDFREGFGPLLPGSTRIPFGDLDALRRELRTGDVAALVVEPMQGKGVYLAPERYWRAAQDLCRAHKTLLVADEVQTGLGRTGRFFAHEHWGLQPDLITVSKALSGGYVPVGAVLSTDEVFMATYRSVDRALVHSSTFGRNQLAMVAGLATLAAFDEEDIVDRVRPVAPTWWPRSSRAATPPTWPASGWRRWSSTSSTGPASPSWWTGRASSSTGPPSTTSGRPIPSASTGSTSRERATCWRRPKPPVVSGSSIRARWAPSACRGRATAPGPTRPPMPKSITSSATTTITSSATTSSPSTWPSTRCSERRRKGRRSHRSCRPSPSARATGARPPPASWCWTSSTGGCPPLSRPP